MWTPEQVARMAAEEQMAAFKRKNPAAAERMEIMQLIREAFRKAHERYVLRYAEIKRDFELGLIGPEGQPNKRRRDEWVAEAVRRSLLRELHAESPIVNDCSKRNRMEML